MEIHRGTGVAVWRQIKESLEYEIESGNWKPGSRCPTEQALASRFGVNRHTVRRAIAALSQRGMLRVEQGRGTFVTEQVLEYPLGVRTRFHAAVVSQQRQPGGRLMTSETIAASVTVGKGLGLPAGAPVIHLQILHEADNRPICVASHFFPAVRFPDMINAYSEAGSITDALTRQGVTDYLRKSTRVSARMPSREEAELLDQPTDRPVMVTESVNVDLDGTVIEFGQACFSGDRVHFLMEP